MTECMTNEPQVWVNGKLIPWRDVTVMVELQKKQVREAAIKLNNLYRQKDEAMKILVDLEREIDDYLEELAQHYE